MDNNEQGTPQNPEVAPETTAEETSTEETQTEENDAVTALQKQLDEANSQIHDLTGKLKRATKEPKKAETKEEAPAKAPSKPGDLDYGEKAFLKSYGISGSDELSLVKQFQDRGFELDSIVEDDVFTAKLDNLREARATTAATPKGSKRPGQTGTTDLDMAIAKYKETGELPSDFALRNKVIDAAIVGPSKSETSMWS